MKKDTLVLLATSLLCAVVFSVLKIKPFVFSEFVTVLLGGFVLLAFFSFAFYKFDPANNYNDVKASAVFDTTGISFMDELSFWSIGGKKRIAIAIILQVLITVVAYFFMK